MFEMQAVNVLVEINMQNDGRIPRVPHAYLFPYSKISILSTQF